MRPLSIGLITPAPSGSRKGNRITALRWARLLRELGHRVEIAQAYGGRSYDLLVALHARRSHAAVVRFHREYPGRPLLVALTGTDLYGDIRTSPEAKESLEIADRLILLQPMGAEELPERLRGKVAVIYQSASPPPKAPPVSRTRFDICVMGHLRPVKDPFRAARAARLLPPSSRVRVLQVGGALSPEMEAEAQAEAAANPRYRWLGELPRWRALRVLARCRLLVLTSISEGGANVISEAVVVGVPVLSSSIPGSIGLLGPEYPGYFPVGDTRALADQMARAETDAAFLASLRAECLRLAPRFHPATERRSWEELLRDLV
jgi:putative glycosyltransferase (TIGR04348 family)